MAHGHETPLERLPAGQAQERLLQALLQDAAGEHTAALSLVAARPGKAMPGASAPGTVGPEGVLAMLQKYDAGNTELKRQLEEQQAHYERRLERLEAAMRIS